MFIDENKVRVGVEADSWQEAIHLAGDLLVRAGDASPEYTKAMIEAVLEYGPYIVLAPGMALAHARPESGSYKIGLSAILLKTPVYFGNPDNDPVKIVLALSAIDNKSHLNVLQKIGEVFSDQKRARLVFEARTSRELMENLAFGEQKGENLWREK